MTRADPKSGWTRHAQRPRRATEPRTADGEPSASEIAALVGAWTQSALHMEIGFRAEALRLDPMRIFPWALASVPPISGQAAFPGLERLGERLIHRLDGQIEALMASLEAIDDLDRQRLLRASNLCDAAAAACEIAPALVAGFGLAPQIAPLAAAAFCHRGSPARWAHLSGGGRREALSTIARLSRPV